MVSAMAWEIGTFDEVHVIFRSFRRTCARKCLRLWNLPILKAEIRSPPLTATKVRAAFWWTSCNETWCRRWELNPHEG